MLRSRLHVLPLLPFLFFFQPAAHAGAQTGHVSLSARDVHIYNLVGSVEVVAGPGPSVGVDITKQGKDGTKLEVKQFTENGSFLVIKYPSDKIKAPFRKLGWGGSTTLEIANDGTFGDRPKRSTWFGRKVRIGNSGLDAWCDLRVSVPKG